MKITRSVVFSAIRRAAWALALLNVGGCGQCQGYHLVEEATMPQVEVRANVGFGLNFHYQCGTEKWQPVDVGTSPVIVLTWPRTLELPGIGFVQGGPGFNELDFLSHAEVVDLVTTDAGNVLHHSCDGGVTNLLAVDALRAHVGKIDHELVLIVSAARPAGPYEPSDPDDVTSSGAYRLLKTPAPYHGDLGVTSWWERLYMLCRMPDMSPN
jgi:hypothetical protein